MSDELLPQELVEIERLLGARRTENPSPVLRARVMQSVADTLESDSRGSAGTGQMWGYAAALAATLLIGANLAHVGASVTSFIRPMPPSYTHVVATAQALQQLSPDLTPREAARMSAMLLTAEDMPCVPELRRK